MTRPLSRPPAAAAAVLAAAVLAGAAPPAARAQDVAEIRALIANRVETARKDLGLVVAWVGPAGRGLEAGGRTAPGASTVPGGDTVFEIGSISKVFTALLLADMVERGEARFDEPVARLLPAGVTVPSSPGREITLLDLAMHVSGLPRLPDDFKPADPRNPYADYGPDRLYASLAKTALRRPVGESYEYSNLGAGLLGHALSLRAGKPYEALLRERILEPLRMTDTSIALSDSQKKRLAVGSDSALRAVSNWDLGALAGAGAIRSTADDMIKFVAAAMDLEPTPLRAAFARLRSPRRPTGRPDIEVAVGWHVLTRHGTEIVWHNGGTGGYRSFAGFAPAKGLGVVVLANTDFSNDDLGFHVLEPANPAARFDAPRERTEVAVDAAVLDAYVGEYELRAGVLLAVTRAGGRLFARATGQAEYPLLAESPALFYLKAGDAEIRFVRDAGGKVTGLVLRQNGTEITAPKVR